VVDPWITYYGGSDQDASTCISVDAVGNCLVGGNTVSINFPVSAGAIQKTYGGVGNNFSWIYGDAFVVKFSPSGNRLWGTYYGGTDTDASNDIAADMSTGDVVFTGLTAGNFPLSSTPYQGVFGGGYDAFIVKLDANGARVWATYYGGNSEEGAEGVTIDINNDIVITGYVMSSNFPVSAGAFQNNFSGAVGLQSGQIGGDAFVIKLGALGNRIWSTYYGGTDSDYGLGVTTDTGKNIIVTGGTYSANFPTTAGCFQSVFNGAISSALGLDAFIIKFDKSGNRIWATFYGGSSYDESSRVKTDSNNDIVICGFTISTDLPVTAGCYQFIAPGNGDLFLAKFDASGARQWSTYYGTIGWEFVYPICDIDQNKNIYLFGETEDSQSLFPLYQCAFQSTFGGDEDQFIAKFKLDGTFMCSTYLGGASHDELDYGKGGIACYRDYIYVTANSPGYYPITPGAYQTAPVGLNDITVAKLCGKNCGDTLHFNITLSSTQVTNCNGTIANFNSNSNPCDTIDITYLWQFAGATPSSSTVKNPQGIAYAKPGTFPVTIFVNTPCGLDSMTQNITIVGLPAPTSIQGTTIVCPGSNALLSVSGASTANWVPSTGINNPAGISVVFAPSATTSYTVSGTATNGCTYSWPVTITASQLNVTASSDVNICYGESTNLSAAGAATYTWTPAIGLNNFNTPNVMANPIATTTYVVTGIDTYYCFEDKQVVVVVNPIPVISVSIDSVICQGENLVLSASGADNYTWSPAATLASATGRSITATPSKTTIYKVLGDMNATGCVGSATVTIKLTPKPMPQTSISPSCDLIILSAYLENATYLWSTNEQSSSIFVDKPGEYRVITTKDNCTSNDTLTVTEYPGSSVIWFPNSFTPNNDGLNEIFTGYADEVIFLIYKS